MAAGRASVGEIAVTASDSPLPRSYKVSRAADVDRRYGPGSRIDYRKIV